MSILLTSTFLTDTLMEKHSGQQIMNVSRQTSMKVRKYSQILDIPFDNTVLKLMTQRRGGGGVAQLPSCPVAQVGGYSLQALS